MGKSDVILRQGSAAADEGIEMRRTPSVPLDDRLRFYDHREPTEPEN
jgi:hypothetical protein